MHFFKPIWHNIYYMYYTAKHFDASEPALSIASESLPSDQAKGANSALDQTDDPILCNNSPQQDACMLIAEERGIAYSDHDYLAIPQLQMRRGNVIHFR